MMWNQRRRTHSEPMIGQAWMGRHVILIHCSTNNEFLQMYKSKHAPTEPPHQNCAETLSQLLSIGYTIQAITPISPREIQYLLVLV